MALVTSIELRGNYLAIAIQNMQLRDQLEADDADADAATCAPLPAVAPSDIHPSEIVYYAGDECVMVDGEYLIRRSCRALAAASAPS